ncbi:MAG: hypothetical protein ABI042_14685 [Verrucomicrobiota bacterium]
MNSDSVQMRKINYGGWDNCIELSNGQISLIATTEVGPRIIRLAFAHGENLFKEFPDQMGKSCGEKWRAYGGHRFWHAPEVMPRSYAPDNSAIAHQWDGKLLRLIQPVETSTGFQKEIEVTLDPQENHVTVLHRLTNKNLWPIEVAPWALTVMEGPGRAIFPQERAGNQLLPVRPLALWGYTNMKDARWIWGEKYIQLRCDPAASHPQKIGMMNTLGWAAYVREEDLFLKRFAFDPKAVYPDFGCNTESYTNGDMLEMESLGPLARLDPQAAVEHTEHWFVRKMKISENEEDISRQLSVVVEETDRLI